jgi:hypothetical protein
MVARTPCLESPILEMTLQKFAVLIQQWTSDKPFGTQWNETRGTPGRFTGGKGSSRGVVVCAEDALDASQVYPAPLHPEILYVW